MLVLAQVSSSTCFSFRNHAGSHGFITHSVHASDTLWKGVIGAHEAYNYKVNKSEPAIEKARAPNSASSVTTVPASSRER